MDKNVTRRQIGLILGMLGVGSAASTISNAQPGKPGTAIHQELDFKATSARIYQALADAKQFSEFTKDKAEFEARSGAATRLFGGRIEGRNIELIPNQRIVQAWRPAYWEAGVYSLVKIELSANGMGTRLVLDHTGFGEDKWEGLNDGWPKMYWEPLRKYLNA